MGPQGFFEPVRPMERWIIAVGLPLAVLGFGWVTLGRAVFLEQSRTDADVFFRAAWAVRAGADIYGVTDANGWHYLYPSLFAILMWPFANPPPGVTMAWTMPFEVSVGLWYGLSVVFMAVAAHWIARAVELSSDDPLVRETPPLSRRWWSLRLWPVLIGSIAVGSVLSRGQVGTLLLMLIAGSMLSATRGHSFRAGLWLAAAIVLKVIPAFLLLYPLWRRDWRWLAGSAAGLVLGLVVLPAVAAGPEWMWANNVRWVEVMFLERFGSAEAATRFKELHSLHKIDNQSPLSLFHHWAWIGTARELRPEQASVVTKLAHLGFAGLVTLATMWAAGLWRTRAAGGRENVPLVMGLLLVAMLVTTPVCHPDYFSLLIPLFAVLWSRAMQETRGAEVQPWAWGLVVVYVVGNFLPRLDALWMLKLYGLGMFLALGVWLFAAVILRRTGGHLEVGRAVGGPGDGVRRS